MILGKDYQENENILLGIISSKMAVTALDSRISICRSFHLNPQSVSELIALVNISVSKRTFLERIRSTKPATLLSKKLSGYFIERSTTIPANEKGMRFILEYLPIQKLNKGNIELQENAVQVALTAFGISKIDQKAVNINCIEGKTTALA